MQLIRITFILSFILFLSSRMLAQQTGSDTVGVSPRSSWNAKEARPYKQHVPVQGDDIYSYFENGYIVEEVKKLMAVDSK